MRQESYIQKAEIHLSLQYLKTLTTSFKNKRVSSLAHMKVSLHFGMEEIFY